MAIEEQQIMDAVIERLSGISIDEGYLTDIGTNVEDSRVHWDQEDDLDAISVFEGTVTSDEYANEGLLITRTMPVMIKAFLKQKATAALTAAHARKVMADIYAAIRNDDTWTITVDEEPVRLARHTLEKSHGIEYAENTFEITGCQVEIEIEYFGAKFNLEG